MKYFGWITITILVTIYATVTRIHLLQAEEVIETIMVANTHGEFEALRRLDSIRRADDGDERYYLLVSSKMNDCTGCDEMSYD